MLPITLEAEAVGRLFDAVEATSGFRLSVDLAVQTITLPDGAALRFEIDAEHKHRLLGGLGDSSLTLQQVDPIRGYEAKRRLVEPWLFT